MEVVLFQKGETDDPVMATVLVVRIAQQVAQYDESAYDEPKDSFTDEDVESRVI